MTQSFLWQASSRYPVEKSQQLQINSIAVSISLGFQNIAKVKHQGANILSYVIWLLLTLF